MRRLHTLQRAIPTGAGDPLRHPSIGGSVSAGGGGTPTLSSATIATTGKTISLVFSESVSVGAGGNGGVTVSPSVTVATATYSSGSGSNTLVYSLSNIVSSGETATVSYTQPGNGIEATTGGGDVATFSGSAVTNSSTAPAPNVWAARCEDNTSTETVVAWVGSNGAFAAAGTDTSTQSTTDHYEGSRAFALTSFNTIFAPSVASSGFSDLVFTVQIALKATTAFNSSNYVRLMDMMDSSDYSEDIFIAIHGDTQIYFYFMGNEYNVTVNDLSSGAWQVLRIVVDTGATNKIAIYQGANEGSLALTGYRTDSIAMGGSAAANLYPGFGGDAANAPKCFSANGALIDDIKLWNTAVVP